MIATLALVLTFVVIGLTVVFVAFSGGPKRMRGRRRRSSPATRGVLGLLLAVVVVGIGVVIPALVLAENSENRSKKAPGGVELNAAQDHGRTVFAQRCAQCHTLRAANAVGKVGPNLDQLRPPKALTLDAIKNGRARGQGQMPAGLVDGQDAEDVAEFVEAVAGR